MGCAKPVLETPKRPKSSIGIALQGEHHVDHVLEQLGSGQSTFLVDMPHDDGGDAVGLGMADQAGGTLSNLADSPGSRIHLGHADRLDRVDDQDLRLGLVGTGEDTVHVVVGQQQDLVP